MLQYQQYNTRCNTGIITNWQLILGKISLIFCVRVLLMRAYRKNGTQDPMRTKDPKKTQVPMRSKDLMRAQAL